MFPLLNLCMVFCSRTAPDFCIRRPTLGRRAPLGAALWNKVGDLAQLSVSILDHRCAFGRGCSSAARGSGDGKTPISTPLTRSMYERHGRKCLRTIRIAPFAESPSPLSTSLIYLNAGQLRTSCRICMSSHRVHSFEKRHRQSP